MAMVKVTTTAFLLAICHARGHGQELGHGYTGTT